MRNSAATLLNINTLFSSLLLKGSFTHSSTVPIDSLIIREVRAVCAAIRPKQNETKQTDETKLKQVFSLWEDYKDKKKYLAIAYARKQRNKCKK